MKTYRPIREIAFLILLTITLNTFGEDPVKFVPSINYYRDLSDTYGGGGLLTGELLICKSWYGLTGSFGHFQSQSTFVLKIPVPELNSTLKIPIEEMTIMQCGTLSGLIRPVNQQRITVDILFGFCLNNAKSLFSKEVKYSYNINEGRFTELIKDYQLVKSTRTGYQLGLNVSFYVSHKVGLQICVRMQDLTRGGSFFFTGGGLCLRL